jgi:hypothetical protein
MHTRAHGGRRLAPLPGNASRLVLLGVALAASGSVGPSRATAGQGQAAPCSSPQYRQFDFWLGDWDVIDAGTHERVARARVRSILGGCVVLEEYRGSTGSKGRSFSIYDVTRAVWHQTWVTDRGRLLVIEGHFRGGVMAMEGSDRAAAGAPERLVRGRWQALGHGLGVRESADRSIDAGKSWQPWFDLIFRPHSR